LYLIWFFKTQKEKEGKKREKKVDNSGHPPAQSHTVSQSDFQYDPNISGYNKYRTMK